MTAFFGNVSSQLKTPKVRKALGILALASLVIYLLIGISSYAQWFKGSTAIFVYSSTSGMIFRVLSSGLVLGVSLLIFISYFDQINKKWLLVFLAIIFFSMLSTIYTTTSYLTLYRTTRLYNFMAEYYVSVSTKEILKMQISFLIDIAFGFCFLFVLPKVIKKKHIIIIFTLFLLIIFYSCIYSLVKEKAYYLKFLSGDWSYRNDTVGSIFGNKQQWGIFLISAFPICFINIYLVVKEDFKKIFKILFILFSAIVAFMVFALGGMSFCKTEIISSVLFVFAFAVGLVITCLISKKYRKKGFILLGALVALTICLTIVIIKVPQAKQIFDNIINTFDTYSEESIGVRFTLVFGVFKNFPTTNLIFGMPKAIADPFVRSLMPEIKNGLHTGIAIYFVRTGIFGLVIFILLCIVLIKKYIKLHDQHPLLSIILISTFAVSIILNLSEADILIFSSSMVGYMLNIALVTLPFSKDLKEGCLDEKNVCISC